MTLWMGYDPKIVKNVYLESSCLPKFDVELRKKVPDSRPGKNECYSRKNTSSNRLIIFLKMIKNAALNFCNFTTPHVLDI